MAKKQRKERNRNQHIESYRRIGIETRLEEHLQTTRETYGKSGRKKGQENEEREREKQEYGKPQRKARVGDSKEQAAE